MNHTIVDCHLQALGKIQKQKQKKRKKNWFHINLEKETSVEYQLIKLFE